MSKRSESFGRQDFELPRFKPNLDRLVASAGKFLMYRRAQQTLRLACKDALWALPVLPLLMLVAKFTASLAGLPFGHVSVWAAALLAIAGPVLYVLARMLWVVYRHHPARHRALSLYDKQLNTFDRLVIADEFLSVGSGEVSPELPDARAHGFRQAAIADAGTCIHSALSSQLAAMPLSAWRVKPFSWLGVPAAVVVTLLLSMTTGMNERSHPGAAPMLAALAPNLLQESPAQVRESLRSQSRGLTPEQVEPQSQPTEPEISTPEKPKSSRNDKAPAGELNAGNPAAARASNTANSAAGNPSNQKNASKSKKPDEPEAEEPETNKAAQKKPGVKKEEKKSSQLAMSSSSGEGKSMMSGSKAGDLELQDEEEQKGGKSAKQESQEEESEDEDEQEKSDNANKPGMKNLKGAANSNLTQGTLSTPGLGMRGSYGERRKTRGVASLVLGIPLVDRIQGQTNKGRSKVTLEDAKPKQESHPLLEAQAREARAGRIGVASEPVLLPWMKTLVERYFIALRQNVLEDSQAGVAEEAEASGAAVSSDELRH